MIRDAKALRKITDFYTDNYYKTMGNIEKCLLEQAESGVYNQSVFISDPEVYEKVVKELISCGYKVNATNPESKVIGIRWDEE